MTAPLRLGVLTTVFPRFVGDLAGHFVLSCCRELQRRGVSATVLAPHVTGTAVQETVEGVPVHRFRYLWPEAWQRVSYDSGTLANLRRSWRARLGLPFLLAAFWLRAGGLARRCELLHAHWIPAGLIALTCAPVRSGWLRLRGRRRPPVVVTVWGSDLALLRVPLLGPIARRLLRRAAAVVAVSSAMRDELLALGLPPERLTVVLTAMDELPRPSEEPARLRQRLGLPLDVPLALFLGRLSPVKGPHVLVEAARLLRDRQPSAHYVLAGEGQLRQELEAVVRRCGLQDRVTFAGFVAREHVGEYLAACDVLVLPSLSEGLPHSVLEAMAFSRPVVASAVGGVPEVVEDGRTGRLVPPGDPVALAEALEPLFADGELCARWGAAARAFFERKGFTWDRVARELEQLYVRARSSNAPVDS